MTYWNQPYGWRAGPRYIDPDATAADVIRFELEEYDNDLGVPGFLLEELDRKQVRARDVVWVCRTREQARRYGDRPYREEFGVRPIVLAEDGDDGYLVLMDSSPLDPSVVERFALYRQMQSVEGVSNDGLE